MTEDTILMLSTIDSISWKAQKTIYAFSVEDTNPDDTNGWDCDIEMPYTIFISASIKPKTNNIGKYYVCASVTFAPPFTEHKEETTIYNGITIEASLLRDNQWEVVLTTLQALILNANFWTERRKECEEYLRHNAPAATADPV